MKSVELYGVEAYGKGGDSVPLGQPYVVCSFMTRKGIVQLRCANWNIREIDSQIPMYTFTMDEQQRMETIAFAVFALTFFLDVEVSHED